MRREKIAAFDLKAAREIRKLSQDAVAAILCTTQASVSRWEAAGTLPAVYRKAWEQHWKLEKLSTYRKAWEQHWKLEKLSNGETNRDTVERPARPPRCSGKAGRGKKGNKRSNKRTRSRAQKSIADMPISSPVQLVQSEE